MPFSRRMTRVVAMILLAVGSVLPAACGSTLTLPAATSTSEALLEPASDPASTTLAVEHFPLTTSTTLLFPQQPSFMQELFGEGYRVAIVFKDQRGGAAVTKVWITVDPNNAARATNDAIFDHAVALAEVYGAADSTEGRLRVELSDAPNGEFIKDHIIESRDFDVHSPASANRPS